MRRSGAPGGKQQIKKEEIKQAVVIDVEEASLCQKRLLAGKPLLSYSLDWLRLEKFHEVFICCLPNNAQEIRDYIVEFKLNQSGSHTLNIQVHASEKNHSIGDCLRDLDSKALIKTDFVLMKVGCCGNINLSELLEKHKKLRTEDKQAILTSIARCAPPKQMINQGVNSIYICDSKNGRLLHFIKEETSNQKKKVKLPTKTLLEYESLKIHSNLVDTGLAIYSQNVPILFSENFDFRTQADLITGIFDNEEVLGYTIYVHLLDDQYNQSVANPLGCMSQDLKFFDADFVFKRRDSYNILRRLSSESLVQCTRLDLSNNLVKHMEESDDDSESSDEDISLVEDDVRFYNEVLESYTRAFEEHIENENLVLEINSSKHAYYISIKDLHCIIIKALLELPYCIEDKTKRPNTSTDYFNMEKQAIKKFQSVFSNYIRTSEARAAVLETMEEVLLNKENKLLNEAILAKLIYEFYDIDILDEESIINWVNEYDIDDDLKEGLRKHPGIKALARIMEQSESEDDDDD